MLGLIIVLVIILVCLQFIAIPQPLKNILYAILCILLILVLLDVAGVISLGSFHLRR